MEEADGGGFGAARRGWKLLGAAADVPVALFLPPGSTRGGRRQHGSGGCGRYVQQHVPEPQCPPPRSPQTTARAARAHPRARAGGAASPQPTGDPTPPVKMTQGRRREVYKINNTKKNSLINEHRH